MYMYMHIYTTNPTGVDPTKEQWEAIADVGEERQ
jgi:aspartate/tyrosine/aromatic aminotransferase